MASKNTSRRRTIVYVAGAFVAFGVVCLILLPSARFAVVKTVLPGVYITKNLNITPKVSGMNFDVVYTNCDTLVKEDSVSIYASKALDPGASLVTKWFNRKTLIFSYVPGRSEAPSITTSGNRILISVPDVSSIQFQGRKWQNAEIDYSIGHIYYP